jgi:uncharacterized damage-inducible protein DinB
MTVTSTERPDVHTRERQDLLETLALHRGFLRFTVQNLTDEQATTRSTVSELTLAGLIHHVAETEAQWADFIRRGPASFDALPGFTDLTDAELQTVWESKFQLPEGQSLADALEHYAQVAAGTDELVRTVPDLDADHLLPAAPWFQPGARWSVRRTVLHIVAETSQHAGHADILREAIDGQKTMG